MLQRLTSSGAHPMPTACSPNRSNSVPAQVGLCCFYGKESSGNLCPSWMGTANVLLAVLPGSQQRHSGLCRRGRSVAPFEGMPCVVLCGCVGSGLASPCSADVTASHCSFCPLEAHQAQAKPAAAPACFSLPDSLLSSCASRWIISSF